MYIARLKKWRYQALCESMIKFGYNEPLSDCYTIPLRINHAEYMLKLQIGQSNRIGVLQAIRIHRTSEGHDLELINYNSTLSALFQILLEQGIEA